VRKSTFAKDGSRVAGFCSARRRSATAKTRGVAFVLDLTQRKHAEEALRKAQAELAPCNAAWTTLGELTASIAHEVNQPLARRRQCRGGLPALARPREVPTWTKRAALRSGSSRKAIERVR